MWYNTRMSNMEKYAVVLTNFRTETPIAEYTTEMGARLFAREYACRIARDGGWEYSVTPEGYTWWIEEMGVAVLMRPI